MSLVDFTMAELTAAVSRGVRQFVLVDAGSALREAVTSSPVQDVKVFALDKDPLASGALETSLERSGFDKLKASLFVLLGGATFRSVDAAIGGLGFIASLPKGSGVVLDYVAERTGLGSFTQTALDALATKLPVRGGVKCLIQPQAVAAMLRSLGFLQIVDLAQADLAQNGRARTGGHLVSAVV